MRMTHRKTISSIQEICEFIQPGYASDSPEDRKKFLENSEQVFGQSGRLHYDILSWIRHMKTGEDILINIEMQRTNLSADQLLGRIILYLSQMVQFQKNNDKGFLKDHYEQIKPMRTLWIFPRTRKNKITSAKFKLALANEPDELDRKLAEQLERLFDIQLIFINPEDLATIDKNEALKALYMLFCSRNREATLQYVQKEGIVVERSIEEFVDKYHYSLMAFDETERKELCLCMEEVIRQANETFREKEELEKSYKELEKVNNKLQKRIRELEMSQQK